MGFSREWDGYRALEISRFLNRGYNLHHTCQMIYYAECAQENEKKEELLRSISELRLVYDEHRDKIPIPFRDNIELFLDCARGDIERGDYWGAIMDVFDIERNYLQEYLLKFPEIDKSFRPNVLLTKKIVEGIGGGLAVAEPVDEENDAD